jgi:phosphatidylserine decarboxylase
MYGVLRVLPKKHLSYLIGKLLHIRLPGGLARFSVRSFCKLYNIDPATADRPLNEYLSIGDFFVRDLKHGLRPIGSGMVSPVDGTLREWGDIVASRLPQIKGIDYSLDKFLNDSALAERYRDGTFFNFYLAPPDYHHIHSPVSGKVISVRHIPGTLWPVNDWSMSNVPALFELNERVVVTIESDDFGLVTVVMVGATNVGKITLAFDTLITNLNPFDSSAEPDPAWREYSPGISMRAGKRLGTFHMGSSVVVLCEKGRFQPKSELNHAPTKIQYGVTLGSPRSGMSREELEQIH